QDGWIRLARGPAMRAALLNDVFAELFAAIALPQPGQIEAVVPEVADLGVPDRAGEQIPIRIHETGGRKGRARQRRLVGLVVFGNQRLISILDTMYRVEGGGGP